MTQAHSSIADRLAYAEELKMGGDHTDALKVLEEILCEDPENIAALEEVADNELSVEHYRRAETAARRAIALDATSYTGHYILGFLYSHEEQWNQALTHLRIANKYQPNNAEILRCLGWALFRNGSCPQGVVTLERALNLERDNTLILCDLGVVYLQLRRFAKARALFVHALEMEPDNDRARECVQAVEKMEKDMS